MSTPPLNKFRPLIAVIGEAGAKEADSAFIQALALGELLVNSGFRICNGGLSGVMSAVFQGARRSKKYQSGDTVAILPGLNHRKANEFADIVIATGMGHLRNGIVAAAEAVIVVGGKAGTLSEIALAWRYNRLIIALSNSGGAAAEYAGKSLDNRPHRHKHPALRTILDAKTPEDAVSLLGNLADCYFPPGDFRE